MLVMKTMVASMLCVCACESSRTISDMFLNDDIDNMQLADLVRFSSSPNMYNFLILAKNEACSHTVMV
jgi:hypothetical protein